MENTPIPSMWRLNAYPKARDGHVPLFDIHIASSEHEGILPILIDWGAYAKSLNAELIPPFRRDELMYIYSYSEKALQLVYLGSKDTAYHVWEVKPFVPVHTTIIFHAKVPLVIHDTAIPMARINLESSILDQISIYMDSPFDVQNILCGNIGKFPKEFFDDDQWSILGDMNRVRARYLEWVKGLCMVCNIRVADTFRNECMCASVCKACLLRMYYDVLAHGYKEQLDDTYMKLLFCDECGEETIEYIETPPNDGFPHEAFEVVLYHDDLMKFKPIAK